MTSIQTYENEIFSQPQFLTEFIPQKPLSKTRQKNIIFSGSGDSLMSAMLAEVYSDYLAKSFDPLDLLKNTHLLKNKTAFFVSVSGNTISNIKLARWAKKPIAVTSNIKSRLANGCKNTIKLNFPKSEIVTAGSVSFLDSALTCISLVRDVSVPKNSKIFDKAVIDSKKSKIGKRVFILGNMHTYPLAMYCCAKIYEVLGYDAHFTRIEQFSHMELFSCKKGDTVIIFERKNKHNKHLVQNLKNIGLNVIQPRLNSKNPILQLLYYVYFSQLLVLFEAKRIKKKECHFILEKQLKNASSSMIY